MFGWSPLIESFVFFFFVWKVKIPKKIEFFMCQIFNRRVNTLDRISSKVSNLVEPFVLLFGREQLKISIIFFGVGTLKEQFGVVSLRSLAIALPVLEVVERRPMSFFSTNPFVRDEHLWRVRVCVILWGLGGKRNNRILENYLLPGVFRNRFIGPFKMYYFGI